MAFNKTNRITSKKIDIAKWYTDIITNSDLFEYGPVKGTMILEPDGLALWENIKKILNREFKKIRIDNVSFPLLIPESMLMKEKEHIEGFSPEVLKVTQVGNKKIQDALIIRPTSETLFCDYFSKKINSKAQLPMKYNQWANVMRWENNTRPFLRNSEFFWQEGHTCHATEAEAKETVWQIIDIYKDLIENDLGMALYCGEKSPTEKFAGAVKTIGIESLMPDGQALQIATSHYLGQNFSQPFKIRFQEERGSSFVEQTSWGISTRIIGGLIMAHSDDKGLIIPPNVAPYKVYVSNINPEDPKVSEFIEIIKEELGNITFFEDTSNKGFGFKVMNFEMKGVPIGLFVGKREFEKKEILIVNRLSGEKILVKKDNLITFINEMLTNIQNDLKKTQQLFLNEHLISTTNFNQLIKSISDGNATKAYFCTNKKCEANIKTKYGFCSRVITQKKEIGKCIFCNENSFFEAIIARSY